MKKMGKTLGSCLVPLGVPPSANSKADLKPEWSSRQKIESVPTGPGDNSVLFEKDWVG